MHHKVVRDFSKRIVFSFFFTLLFYQCARAQVDTVRLSRNQILVLKDSVIVPIQDTLILLNKHTAYKIKPNPYAKSEVFYDSLRSRAYRSNITRQLHHLIVRSPTQYMYATDSIAKSASFFQAYEGKQIRKLTVSHVPVFAGNVQDTSTVVISMIGQWLNKTKRYTKLKLIVQNVLFHEGEEVDPAVLADSERILRSMPFIEDARIYVKPYLDTQGVEVNIVVKDRFPWALGGNYNSLQDFRLDLSNLNIQGSGNQLHGSYLYNQGESLKNGYEFSYVSQPLGSSFIQIEALLANHWQKNGTQLRVYKDFLSPEIKYGGEFALGDVETWRDVRIDDSTYRLRVRRRYLDVWGGRAFQLRPGSRITLIPALRYMDANYLKRPEVQPDSNEFYHLRKLALGSTSIRKVNYLKTNYILSFGITEDVPVGYAFSVMYGRNYSEFENNNYSGVKVGWAHYFSSFGYLFLSQEAGTFWDLESTDNMMSISTLGYFSPLLSLGRTRIRNFLQLKYHFGNRLNIPQSIDLQEGIRGVDESLAQSKSVLSGRIESVWFTPWYFYGFRFAPFAFYDFGKVSDARIQEAFNIYYDGLGAGIRIRNESLILRTFEWHVSWMPNPPEDGKSFAMGFTFTIPLIFENILNTKPKVIFLE